MHLLSSLRARYRVDRAAFEHSLLPERLHRTADGLLEWTVLVEDAAATSTFRARRIRIIQGGMQDSDALAAARPDLTFYLTSKIKDKPVPVPASWCDTVKLGAAFEAEARWPKVRAVFAAGVALLEQVVLARALGEGDPRDTDAPYVVALVCNVGRERSRLLFALWLAALAALAYAPATGEADDAFSMAEQEVAALWRRTTWRPLSELLLPGTTPLFQGYLNALGPRFLRHCWPSAAEAPALLAHCVVCGIAQPAYRCGSAALCTAVCFAEWQLSSINVTSQYLFPSWNKLAAGN